MWRFLSVESFILCEYMKKHLVNAYAYIQNVFKLSPIQPSY